jgi:hypothetical protein
MGNELERAEAHLHSAEVDMRAAKAAEEAAIAELKAAEAAEETAIHETEKALEEIKEAAHAIHFMVDGEPYETEKHELTPDEIIRNYAERDPATHYLVQITGGEKISYQSEGNKPIKMHDGMRFQVLSTGPMTVSDGRF